MTVKIGLKTCKIIYIVIAVIVIAGLVFAVLSDRKTMDLFFSHEEISYDTASECIEASLETYTERYPEDNSNDYKFKNSIYLYENENQYVELLNTCDGRVWCYILDKNIDGEKTTYKYNYSATVSLSNVWYEGVKGYCFKIVDNQQDVETYNEKEPIVAHITYQYFNDYCESYLLFVDNTSGNDN